MEGGRQPHQQQQQRQQQYQRDQADTMMLGGSPMALDDPRPYLALNSVTVVSPPTLPTSVPSGPAASPYLSLSSPPPPIQALLLGRDRRSPTPSLSGGSAARSDRMDHLPMRSIRNLVTAAGDGGSSIGGGGGGGGGGALGLRALSPQSPSSVVSPPPPLPSPNPTSVWARSSMRNFTLLSSSPPPLSHVSPGRREEQSFALINPMAPHQQHQQQQQQ